MSKNKKLTPYSSLKGGHRAVPIILIALAAFIGLCFITKDIGAFGYAISSVFLGLFSYGAYLIPLLLVLHAIFYASDINDRRVISRIVFSLVAITAIAALAYTFTYWKSGFTFDAAAFYRDGKASIGGGFIGSIIGFCLVKVFGRVGLVIIALAIFAIYVSYFFAKGKKATSRILLAILRGIVDVCAFIEEKIKAAFGAAKNAKNEKAMHNAEQKSQELIDDEFFAVDNGMQKLQISDLGIKETRTKESLEYNPTLQDKVFHKSAVSQEEAEKMEMRERAEEIFYASAKANEEMPHFPKRRIVNVTYGEFDEPEKDIPETVEDVEETVVEEAMTEEATNAPVFSAPVFGATNDDSADSIFTQEFDPFSLVMSEELASKPSSRSLLDDPDYSRTVTEKVTEMTEAEIIRAQNLQEFEKRKAEIVNARRAVPVETEGEFTGVAKPIKTLDTTAATADTSNEETDYVSFKVEKNVEPPKTEPANYTAIGYGSDDVTTFTISKPAKNEEPITLFEINNGDGFDDVVEEPTPAEEPVADAIPTYIPEPIEEIVSAPKEPAVPEIDEEPVYHHTIIKEAPVSAAPEVQTPAPTVKEEPVANNAEDNESNAYASTAVSHVYYSKPIKVKLVRPRVYTPVEESAEPMEEAKKEDTVPVISSTPVITPTNEVPIYPVHNDAAEPKAELVEDKPEIDSSYVASNEFGKVEDKNEEFTPSFIPYDTVRIQKTENNGLIFEFDDDDYKTEEPETLTIERTIISEEPTPVVFEAPKVYAPEPDPVQNVEPAPVEAPVIVEEPKPIPEPAPTVYVEPAPTEAPVIVEEPKPIPEPAPTVYAEPAPTEAPVIIDEPKPIPEPAPVVFVESTNVDEAPVIITEPEPDVVEDSGVKELFPHEDIPEEEEDDVSDYNPNEDGEPNEDEIPVDQQNPVVIEQRSRFGSVLGDNTDDSSDDEPYDGVLISPDEIEDSEYDEYDDEDEPPFDGGVITDDEDEPVEEEKPKKKRPNYSNYVMPPIDLLGLEPDVEDDTSEINENTKRLIDTLASFNVTASIKGVDRGPRITRYEVVPARGVKVQAVTNRFEDITLNLAKKGVRMEAPIPGKAAIGFEIPNEHPKTVRLCELLECEEFVNARSKTFTCIGKDVAGLPVFADIAKFPHALVAGATGMGKSVCINAMMISILYKARPDEVKLIMIDPKKIEFKMYSGIPHLLIPVVTEAKQAAGALMWAVEEMERRFLAIEELNVRGIDAYNEKVTAFPELGEKMPKIIIVIDELNDLMMQVRDPVEDLIMRLAQKARASGIHIIIGTQRPDVKVITGTIKANINTRLSCKVSSAVDSRTILEMVGAEKLLDKGDMLFKPMDKTEAIRVQGAFVSDSEVESIMNFLKSQSGEAVYDDEIFAEINAAAQKCGNKKSGGGMADDFEDEGHETSYYGDQQFLDAVDLAIRSKKISTSLLQRKLSIGYGKAAKYVDMMEEIGVVSEPKGQKPRDVLISMDEWHEKLSRVSLD